MAEDRSNSPSRRSGKRSILEPYSSELIALYQNHSLTYIKKWLEEKGITVAKTSIHRFIIRRIDVPEKEKAPNKDISDFTPKNDNELIVTNEIITNDVQKGEDVIVEDKPQIKDSDASPYDLADSFLKKRTLF